LSETPSSPTGVLAARPVRGASARAFKIIVAIFVFGNFVVPHLLVMAVPEWGEVFAFSLGMSFGENALLAVWAVFGLEPWAWRIILSLFVALLLFVADLAARIVMGGGVVSFAPGFVLQVCLEYPLIIISILLPIYCFKIAVGYDLVIRGKTIRSLSRSRQISLTDLFLLTAIIAIAFAMVRFSISMFDRDVRSVLRECLSHFVASVFIVLPSVWAALIARRHTVALLFVVVCQFAGAGIFATIDIAVAWKYYVGLIGALIPLHAGLFVFRASGFRICGVAQESSNTG